MTLANAGSWRAGHNGGPVPTGVLAIGIRIGITKRAASAHMSHGWRQSRAGGRVRPDVGPSVAVLKAAIGPDAAEASAGRRPRAGTVCFPVTKLPVIAPAVAGVEDPVAVHSAAVHLALVVFGRPAIFEPLQYAPTLREAVPAAARPGDGFIRLRVRIGDAASGTGIGCPVRRNALGHGMHRREHKGGGKNRANEHPEEP